MVPRVSCPLCHRPVVLTKNSRMRWHNTGPVAEQCVGSGLTLAQARPGITDQEAHAVKYTPGGAMREAT